jgi:hypothetical protein
LQANSTLACFCLLRKPFLNQPCINLLSCHEFTVEFLFHPHIKTVIL